MQLSFFGVCVSFRECNAWGGIFLPVNVFFVRTRCQLHPGYPSKLNKSTKFIYINSMFRRPLKNCKHWSAKTHRTIFIGRGSMANAFQVKWPGRAPEAFKFFLDIPEVPWGEQKCPLKRNHFEREISIPTIMFQAFFRGYVRFSGE